MKHEVVPDSQCAASNEMMVASTQARVHFAQEPVNLSTVSAPQDRHVSSRSLSNGSFKRRHGTQDIPASKRRRADLTNNRPYQHPAPPVRINEPNRRGAHSPLTPRTAPRTRLVMDCVEVVSLDDVLRRSKGKAKSDNGRGADDRTRRENIMGAPKTPFVRRTVRARLERDEIGELFRTQLGAILTTCPKKYPKHQTQCCDRSEPRSYRRVE